MERNFGRIISDLVDKNSQEDQESEYAGRPFMDYIWSTLEKETDQNGPSRELLNLRTSLTLMCIHHWGKRIHNLKKNDPTHVSSTSQVWRQEGDKNIRVDMHRGMPYSKTLNSLSTEIEYNSGTEESKVKIELVHNRPDASLRNMTIHTILKNRPDDWAPEFSYEVKINQGIIQSIEKTEYVIGENGFPPITRKASMDFAP